MINRLIFAIVILPLSIAFIHILIASGVWWVITGKNLLWMIDKIKVWLDKLANTK